MKKVIHIGAPTAIEAWQQFSFQLAKCLTGEKRFLRGQEYTFQKELLTSYVNENDQIITFTVKTKIF